MVKVISGHDISDKLLKVLGSENEVKTFIIGIEAVISEAAHGEEFTSQTVIRNINMCLANDVSMIRSNPIKLREAFTTLASLGLLANTPAKEAYILTFGGKADLRIGVAGHSKVIQKVFPKSKIYTKLLSVADKVSQKIKGGKSEIDIDIDFEKNLDLNKKENIRGVYISLIYDDYLREEVVPIAYIDSVDLSRNNRKPGDIWAKHYGAMATKTALIKFSKDLVTTNQGKFPELFYKALEAEQETSGFPPIKNKEEKKVEVKPVVVIDDLEDLEEVF